MKFSVPLALALSAVGVMAAPIQERTDTCCGILNGAIRESPPWFQLPWLTYLVSGNGNPTFDGNGSPVISGNGNGNASPSNSGNGNQAGTINGNKGNGNGEFPHRCQGIADL